MAETRRPGSMFHIVNYSPVYSDPLAQLRLVTPDISSTGVNSFLHQPWVRTPTTPGSPEPGNPHHRSRCLVPGRGKTTLAVTDEEIEADYDNYEDGYENTNTYDYGDEEGDDDDYDYEEG